MEIVSCVSFIEFNEISVTKGFYEQDTQSSAKNGLGIFNALL